MILKLIDDVIKSLDAECYLSALASALTFPDVCGMAEYPRQKRSGIRYKDWYDEFIGKFEQCPSEQNQEQPMPYLSGEVIYSLRNSLLHQGTPNINVSNIKDYRNKIDHFELVIESKRPFDIYGDTAEIHYNGTTTYRVNVRRLCLILCSCARGYYDENKDKFVFLNCTIIDLDAKVKEMHT